MQTSVSSIIQKHGKQSVGSFADTSTIDYFFENDPLSGEGSFMPDLSRFEGMAFNYGMHCAWPFSKALTVVGEGLEPDSFGRSSIVSAGKMNAVSFIELKKRSSSTKGDIEQVRLSFSPVCISYESMFGRRIPTAASYFWRSLIAILLLDFQPTVTTWLLCG